METWHTEQGGGIREMAKENPQTDVLLITTLKDELDVVLETEPDWQNQSDGSGFVYYTRNMNGSVGNELSVAVALPIDEGGNFSADIAARLTHELKPRCLSMIGVCAGWMGKFALGDLVVGERVFRYDVGKLKAFQIGKMEKQAVFQDIPSCAPPPSWVQKMETFPPDWVRTLKTRPPRVIPHPYQPRVHIAPMGTKGQEEKSPELVPTIANHVRSVLEIDMEAAAIGAVTDIGGAGTFVIVKTVVDHEHHETNPRFRFYAIEASYRFLTAFLKLNPPWE